MEQYRSTLQRRHILKRGRLLSPSKHPCQPQNTDRGRFRKGCSASVPTLCINLSVNSLSIASTSPASPRRTRNNMARKPAAFNLAARLDASHDSTHNASYKNKINAKKSPGKGAKYRIDVPECNILLLLMIPVTAIARLQYRRTPRSYQGVCQFELPSPQPK